MFRRSISSAEGRSGGNQENIPRCFLRDPNNPFYNLTAEEFLQKFRLSKGTVAMVLHELQSSRLPQGGRCETAEAILGADGTKVQSVIRDVSMGICNSLRERYLSFPDNYELSTFQDDFYNVADIRQIIGCVIDLCVPINVNIGREMGVNDERYGEQVMKVLAVCGPQGQITHVIVQTHDVYYDWQIFCESMLLTTLTMGEYGQVVLLTDGSYPIHPFLLRPTDAQSPASLELFNLCHFVTWQSTKKKFDEMMTRFPCLTNNMDPIYPTNVDVVMACAVLHNVSLRCRTPLPVSGPREPDPDPDVDQAQQQNDSYHMEE
ncbi:putative nuclease HARBI1 isoform X2 [Panulirus ornatus]|uniref:putative nuclease HARBI1 isoform X2 n=1 Tax=Panulirus ornatus TaxID=150431 RepID=UPI003A88F142